MGMEDGNNVVDGDAMGTGGGEGGGRREGWEGAAAGSAPGRAALRGRPGRVPSPRRLRAAPQCCRGAALRRAGTGQVRG